MILNLKRIILKKKQEIALQTRDGLKKTKKKFDPKDTGRWE